MPDSLPQEKKPGTAIHAPVSGAVSIDCVLMRFSDLVCHVSSVPNTKAIEAAWKKSSTASS
jgi:hypothetical protein